MANLKRYASRRSDDEWYRIIMDCRKSGLSDTRWCQLNNIRPTTFFTAVKRLRDSSYAIPERTADDIYDLTLPSQDVIKVDIVRDIQPPQEYKEATSHIDNSHMIEIEIGGAKISLYNGANPKLVAKTLSFFRRCL